MERFFLEKDTTSLLLVDIQERLAQVMKVKDAVVHNCLHLLELAKLLDTPVIVTEQYPRGLGQTLPEIREALPEYDPVEKLTFNCCDNSDFSELVKKLNTRNIVLFGMETHICVLQTCIGLLDNGFNVHVVKDAICSRKKEDWITGIEYMRDAGAVITCTETVLFQLLKVAGTEEFKIISKRIK